MYYIYKVLTTPVGQIDGRPVFPAVYAYKPAFSGMDRDAWNKKMDFKTGVTSCVAAWKRRSKEQRTNVLVANHDHVYLIKDCTGVVIDDSPEGFDQKPFATGFVPTKKRA